MSRVLLGALAAAVSLAGTMCWEVLGFVEPGAAPVAGRLPAPASVEVPLPDKGGAAQDWVATALGRPVFSTDRRPARGPEEVAPKPAEPMRLAGVVTGPFGGWATFIVAGNSKPVVMKAGAHVGDVLIRSIRQGQVVVVGPDGAIRTLTPTFAAAPPRRP